MENKVRKEEEVGVRSGLILKEARGKLNEKEFALWLELCYNYFSKVGTRAMYNHFERNIENILKKRSTIY